MHMFNGNGNCKEVIRNLLLEGRIDWREGKRRFRDVYARAFPPPKEIQWLLQKLRVRKDHHYGPTFELQKLLDDILDDCDKEDIRNKLLEGRIDWQEGKRRYREVYGRTFPPPKEIRWLLKKLHAKEPSTNGQQELREEILEDLKTEELLGPDTSAND
jgi:hypothetical protein